MNLKSRYEEISDIASYANDLPLEAKIWLTAFVEEEIISNRYHNGPKLNDFEDPKVRSRIYTKNNVRNRDIYTRETSQGTMNYLAEMDLDGESNLEEEDKFD